MKEDMESILLTEEQISAKVKEMGEAIKRDYKGKNLMMVGLLKGSVVFMADLMRTIDSSVAIDFMSVSSYGCGHKTSGVVRITKDLEQDISNFDILVVEDILDSGMTLSYIFKLLKARGPRSLKLCTLLDKPDRRKIEVKVDYCGFQVPDEFVVGYGLDYAQKYRNLPYIGILKPSVYGGK